MTVDGRQRRAQPARVLAARVPAPPSRPDPVARPAARPGLAVRGRGDAERGRCLHPLPARQARVGRPVDPDRPRRGVPPRRCLTASSPPDRRRDRRPEVTPPRRGCFAASGSTSPCGAAASRWPSCSCSASVLYLAVERSLAASGHGAARRARRTSSPAGGRDPGGEPPAGGFIFGGPGSGTFALLAVDDGGQPATRPGRPAGDGIAGRQGAVTATSGRDDRDARATVVEPGATGRRRPTRSRRPRSRRRSAS